MTRKFNNLEQRMVNFYLETFPPFVPAGGDGIPSAGDQKLFYDFMAGLYRTLFETPEVFFRSIHPDDAFLNRFNRRSEAKPELYRHMAADLCKIRELHACLFELGRAGTLENGSLRSAGGTKPKAAVRRLLEACGVAVAAGKGSLSLSASGREGLFTVWLWMATRPKATVFAFARCKFDLDYSYSGDVFPALAGDEQAYRRLTAFLKADGYHQVDDHRDQPGIDFVKEYGPEKSELKDSWGERTKGGISIRYYEQVSEPSFFGLRIPYPKIFLRHFAEMEEQTQDFVAQYFKKCDNCRYCVQTDKTGKRPLAAVMVAYGNRKVSLCPVFPGFGFWFTRLDMEVVEKTIKLLEFIDRLFAAGRAQSAE